MKRNLPTQSIDALILVRDRRIHMSALMLLRIVDHLNTSNQDQGAPIGEVLSFYKEHRRSATASRLVDYTYQGISTMLRKLKRQNLVSASRVGPRLTYRLTKTGISILDNMYL